MESAGSVIIKGDGVLSALATRREFPCIHFAPAIITNEVRSVFIIESDEEVLLGNLRQRWRGFDQNSMNASYRLS